jgi:hypothetical protein
MTDLTNCIGFNNSQEASDKSDFETNYKAGCYKVDDLETMATVFLVDKTYAEFKALIDGSVITWGDVKLETRQNFYDLYLLTDAPL